LLLAQAPATTTNTDAVVQALITEIRELRLTLERSQLLTLRFQAALQANQIRADRLKDLSQQLNVTRNEIAEKSRQSAGLAEDLERIPNLVDPTERRVHEARMPQVKAEMSMINKQLSDLRAQEAFVLGEIQRESAQTDDWSRWLQQFEQSLRPAK
jgi:septal ring factor EnvC (AmiA/AmiB activator)